ncbi:hypothetical protein VB735_26965 [Halotia wernerae UHCC 0503]|nr:hypothetical protein [Halotia wernerae UHCC 0503]
MSRSNDPLQGMAIAIGITLIFNIAAFSLSPFLMDLTQRWLYQITEIETLSPETAKVLRQVCQQKNLKTPRLGIINYQNPTAFTALWLVGLLPVAREFPTHPNCNQ